MTEEERVWRGLALLRDAERRAWRTGFSLGILAGGVALTLGVLLALWLRRYL